LLDSGDPRKDWRVIRTQAEAVADGSMPNGVQREIAQAVTQGFVIFAHRVSPGDDEKLWSWWRIDPKTGTTLGYGQLGWGQGIEEYVMKVTAVGTLGFMGGFGGCLAFNGGSSASPQVARFCFCYGVGGFFAAGTTVLSGLSAGVTTAVFMFIGALCQQAPTGP